MHYFIIFTSFLALASGVFTLCTSRLHLMLLKHSAILLSSVVAAWMTYMSVYHFRDTHICTADDALCAEWMLFIIARNVCQILFHIAIARDALEYGKHERRGQHERWKRNSRPGSRLWRHFPLGRHLPNYNNR